NRRDSQFLRNDVGSTLVKETHCLQGVISVQEPFVLFREHIRQTFPSVVRIKQHIRKDETAWVQPVLIQLVAQNFDVLLLAAMAEQHCEHYSVGSGEIWSAVAGCLESDH